MNSESNKRLYELCDLVTSGLADQLQVDELESLMHQDPAARQVFLNWSALQVDLVSTIQASRSRDALLDRIDQQASSHTTGSHNTGRRYSWLTLLAACLVLGLFVTSWRAASDGAAGSNGEAGGELVAEANAETDADELSLSAEIAIDGMAIVNRVENVVWAESSRPASKGDLLRASRWLEMESGLAEIQFGDGAVVVLEGPARFTAKSTSLGLLDYGTLAAVVPPWAEGFQIDTPTVEVVDRGTEFVVEVSHDKQVTVGVTKGEVEVFNQTDAPVESTEKKKHRLFAGNALHADGSDLNAAVFDDKWHSLSDHLPERPDHTEIEVVARYRKDYVSGVSNKPMRNLNWRYYANYWSDYNQLEGYRELLWDSSREVYDPNGDVARTAGDRLHAANFSYRGGHPGQGRDQSKDDIDHYVVAAYQVTKPGRYRIESGWLVRAESRDDLINQAVDLRVWVDERSNLLEETCNHNGLLQFQGDVGELSEGDWIYVGVGPRTVSHNDRFEWDFAIVRVIDKLAL
ncbi:MAG: FecR family protein [Planctomycetota bacterium]